jgi:hypothetical protein
MSSSRPPGEIVASSSTVHLDQMKVVDCPANPISPYLLEICHTAIRHAKPSNALPTPRCYAECLVRAHVRHDRPADA